MLETVDVGLTQWINGAAGHQPIIDWLMITATSATIPIMVAAVALRWWQRTDRNAERILALDTGLTFLLGLAINQAILLIAHRIRPYDAGITHLIVAPSSDPSFPSDHATAAMSIVAAMLVNRCYRRLMFFTSLAALVMISRIYVGTHYVSDILGGIGTALMAAGIVQATATLRRPFMRLFTRFL